VFRFDNSYLQLPEKFFSKEIAEKAPTPKEVFLNYDLFTELNIHLDDTKELIKILVGNKVHSGSVLHSQAYAGHQFGHFTMLGDGRAIHLGEHLSQNSERFDIQLKGAGPTKFSRRGDGRATLKSMLREYLMSEALHKLGIPSSRSLAVIKTGNDVYRETVHDGAILTRVMKSHIRIGTFEYIGHFGTFDELKQFTDYTINRLYPDVKNSSNPIEAFIQEFSSRQMKLVAQWMSVGFIHGVMNTDNVAISAETFDYGPCAFMNAYHPETVFSSIDSTGRYSFGNQPKIIIWNIVRFIEVMLPLLDPKKEKAIELANAIIETLQSHWNEAYALGMIQKIGFDKKSQEKIDCLNELLSLMQKYQWDYTNTFASLTHDFEFPAVSFDNPELKLWKERWKKLVPDKNLMRRINPVFITRNHRVEEALNEAEKDNYAPFSKLLSILSNPYQLDKDFIEFTKPPNENFEQCYQTFCGT